MRYVINEAVTDSFKMMYLKFGSGAKPLVIIPGLSVQSVMPAAPAIEKQYEIFNEDFTVYLFDRRDNLPEQYSISDMARDTAEAMKALNLYGVSLFGTSQGGMIAMLIAADYPELVSRLALGSTACRIDGECFAAIEKWIELANNNDREGLYLSFGESIYPAEVFNEYKDLLKQTAQTVLKEDLKRFTVLARAIKDFDITDEIKNIKCPVLALGDTDDRVLGGDALNELSKCFKDKPEFETYCYNGFGHAVYDTAPDFTERLYSFFNRL